MSESDTGTEENSLEGANEANVREKKVQPVSRPGGFKNDPDDASNPNEAIERARRQVRP